MQNAQNAAEIQQRVIDLVELYRTKVGKDSEIAKKAKNAYNREEEYLINSYLRDGMSTEIREDVPDEWVKHLQVNEQLLGHFYALVAGEKVEQYVLDNMLPDVYDNTIFTEEDEAFLASHFKEMVNYIILTPCDGSLEWVHRNDKKDSYSIPSVVLELIKSRVKIAKGSKVYYPHAVFAQLANLFDGCKFYFGSGYYRMQKLSEILKKKGEDLGYYAWQRIAIYANMIDADYLEVENQSVSFDAVISFISDTKSFYVKPLYEAYEKLPIGGKLVLVCPTEILFEKNNSSTKKELTALLALGKDESLKNELDELIASHDANMAFRKNLVDDNAIREIIQLPAVMSKHAESGTYCLLIAEKGRSESDAVLIDARVASNNLDSKHYALSFDNAKFNAILQNDGIEPNTGLRKLVKVSSEEFSPEILVPQVYVIERPSETEHPVPLSSLCSLMSAKVRDVQFDLPEDTPWISMSDLTPLYTGDLDISSVRKADCPNNPPYVEGSKEYGFDKDGKFVDSLWSQIGKSNGLHVLDYRRCTYLDGNSDAVLYEQSAESGVQVTVVRATGKPYVVNSGILVFCPKDGFDNNSLAALLRLPIVYRQLIAYQEYELGNHLDDILVPTDKRIIGDELYRMKREETVTNELGDKVQAMKTEYINEVRMRKHDMGQKVFDLINTEDLMRYYVENRETETDVWSQIEEQLDHFRSTIHELSEMLDHLSQEEQFGTPELLDLNDYFSNLQHSNNVNGFTLSYQLDRDSILDVQLSRKKDKNIKEMSSVKATPTIYMAMNDLQRVVSNILTNAQKHGFLDSNRKDYEVNIRLEFNAEKGMYQIDFRNNGKPLPEGLNKIRYGIKGEKAGLTAGTGLGGSVVKSIVEHYKGDYDVFMDGEWTVIRIYLPIAI